jgi:hypothetical protein
MAITLDGTTGIAGIDGSAGTPAVQGADSNTGVFFPAADTVAVATGGTERMRIDSAGRVGIGLTPSTVDPLTNVSAGLLQVNGNIELRYGGVATDPDGARYFNIINTDTTLVADQPLGGIQWVGLDTDNPNSNMASITSYCASNAGTTGDLRFKIAGTESMRIAANNNVGIGTSTPSHALSVARNTVSELAIQAVNAGIGNTGFRLQNSLRHWAIFVNDGDSGPLRFYDYTAAAERMRIDNAGNVLIGNGSAPSSSNQGTQFRNLFNVGAHQISQGAATANRYIDWINANGTIGSIAANGSVVQYNTTSDYRLKENVAPMTGALARIASLKPVTYTWKIDGSDGEGFIAHELAEVCPHAVSGAKDAVDAEGNPKYQGIDTSFLVATLVKAVQEQQNTIAALTARIEALETTQ